MFNPIKTLKVSSIIVLGLMSQVNASVPQESKEDKTKTIVINEEYNTCVQEVVKHFIQEKKGLSESGPAANKGGLLRQIEHTAKKNMTICAAKHPGSMELTEETKKVLTEAGFTTAIHLDVF